MSVSVRSDARKPETDTLMKRGRLQALKIVERVKGVEPSLSALEAPNEVSASG